MKALNVSSAPLLESVQEDRLLRKVSKRLLPLLFVSYIIAYIDRVNLGFAKLQMLDDLHFSAAVYGLGSGIFFIGFILFEVPSNLIFYRVGARFWISRIMITWGAISIATLFVKTPEMFYVSRFLLGAAEAGFTPGVIYYLTQWYPQRRLGRVISTLIAATAVGGILVGPLSGWMMGAFENVGSLRNWQWLFLLQGAPAIVIGFMVWFFLDNSPKEAAWLDDAERAQLRAIVDADRAPEHQRARISDALRESRVWLLGLVLIAANLGAYSVVFWTPTIVKAAGFHQYGSIGLISAIPYATAAAGMLLLGQSSDFFRERRWHIAGACMTGALGLLISILFHSSPWLSIAGISIATGAFVGSTPIIWAFASNFFTDRAAATCLALMNALGALGGFFGPYAMGLAQNLTGSTVVSMLAIAGWAVAGGFLILALPSPRRLRQG
ncbi:MFS transporter [Burkholderia cepacia]|uniref:MFS transporter n=1 Tax=Burkholderia cepacia TaxID=292 RepID=UPI002AB64A3F|nr:MFS transporter [Burkholderia cepacia]